MGGRPLPVERTLFVSLIAVYERVTEGRVHPVTLWPGILVVAMERVLTLMV
jgi:hypothetical protein